MRLPKRVKKYFDIRQPSLRHLVYIRSIYRLQLGTTEENFSPVVSASSGLGKSLPFLLEYTFGISSRLRRTKIDLNFRFSILLFFFSTLYFVFRLRLLFLQLRFTYIRLRFQLKYFFHIFVRNGTPYH